MEEPQIARELRAQFRELSDDDKLALAEWFGYTLTVDERVVNEAAAKLSPYMRLDESNESELRDAMANALVSMFYAGAKTMFLNIADPRDPVTASVHQQVRELLTELEDEQK